MRVLGRATSINVRKVLWTCAEIGIAYERADDGPELAQNPNRLVPVIVDGDFVLWESNTIIRYLATKSSAEKLLPADARKRAEVDRWIDWQATEFNTAWRYAFMAMVRRHADYKDAGQVEASLNSWAKMVNIVDVQLVSAGGHIAGKDFTLADIPIALSVNRWFMTPVPKPRYAALDGYYERMKRRWAPLGDCP
jgi:glutathione S-transferase